MIIKTTLDQRGPITQEEIAMLERAKNLPVVFDEDSPELTEEELKRFHRVNEKSSLERNKQTVMLRLSPKISK